MSKTRILQDGTLQTEELRECWSLINLCSEVTLCESGWREPIDTTVKGPYGGNSMKANPSASANEFCIVTTATFPLDKTHIYFRSFWVKQDVQHGSVGMYWPIAVPPFIEGQPCGPAGQWNRYSAVLDRAQFEDGSYQLRLDYNNNQVASTAWFANLMIVDLTAAFGAGKEPTVEWCDANIPWFQKDYEIPVTKTSIGAGWIHTPLLSEKDSTASTTKFSIGVSTVECVQFNEQAVI